MAKERSPGMYQVYKQTKKHGTRVIRTKKRNAFDNLYDRLGTKEEEMIYMKQRGLEKEILET